MVRFSVLALLLQALVGPLVAATGPDVQAPFFVRQDESGSLVAVVVYGPNPEDQDAVFCRTSIDEFSGPNVIKCRKVDDDYFELILPFTFERDPSDGSIVGVNFMESGETLVIPFRVGVNARGRLHADVNAGDSAAYEQMTIPYLIKRNNDGDVLAVTFTDEEEEQVIPFHYRTNEDGSVSAVFYDVDATKVQLSVAQMLAVAMGVIVGAALAVGVAKFLVRRRTRASRYIVKEGVVKEVTLDIEIQSQQVHESVPAIV